MAGMFRALGSLRSTFESQLGERFVAGGLRRWLRESIALGCMGMALAAAYCLSYWLRFDGHFPDHALRSFTTTVIWFVAVQLAIFAIFRAHRGWRNFVTFYDLVTLVQATTCALLATALVHQFVAPHHAIPRSVFLLDWGVVIVAAGGARALLRILEERSWQLLTEGDKTLTLIVGANATGELLWRSITRNGLPCRVVGFVDQDPTKVGSSVAGVPVLGTIDQTCQLAKRRGASEVLIASGELSGRQVRQLMDDAARHGIHVKVLPSYEQLITGSVSLQPRPVDINDLLRREPAQLELENIREWIDGRVLLVTGSAGSIGSEICRQLLRFSPKRLVLVDRTENGQFFLERELRGLARHVEVDVCMADVLDTTRVAAILEQHRPEIIFHAAAYKHVPMMEAHPGEAVKNIVTATRRLADLAMRHGVESFVMISTDKAVHPTSVMGACKRAAEIYVQSLWELSSCRFVTVRFGNVLDSAGSVVPLFREQIRNGGPITVTDPSMQRFFMTIPEAAGLVLQAGTIGRSGEILLLDMGEPVRIVDLAADMIRLSGLRVGDDIEIRFTGVRPGEKLYEELRVAGETELPTRHPKISIADCRRRDPAVVLEQIEQLEAVADGDDEDILQQLSVMVPTYQSRVAAARKSLAAA
ncbi:MAG TPA: nucleoside-diphosphate sugar epimerase/dehydratase [Thermoguttaceae bacterium]|nr:nucleoside-diphosphate sugar epimerase/dehydratase [Thermoguttaceae bacterium]